jgi:penicillin-binding protein 2
MITPGAFEDRRTLDRRLTGLRIAALIGMGALAISFWVLQVPNNAKYREMADNNHLRTIPLRAPRGVIFDRTGRVLVENRYSFTIALVRELSANVDEALHKLALATGLDETGLRAVVQRRRTEPLFRPLPVIEHATLAQVAAVTARRLELPEIVVQEVPTRAYPADLAAHLFGYVSEIQDAQLDRPEFEGLQAGAVVGQAGIEKIYNARLMGRDGDRYVAVNSKGREIKEVQKVDPEEGQRMQLTIDFDLQQALEDAFKARNFAGAGIALDPRNGEVLALTSQPSFDPNDFANGLDRGKWNQLNTDPLKPLQNRLLQGRYSPGSTFKLVMALAAMSEGIAAPDTRIFCPGSITLYDHVFHCDKREGHGLLDMRHAIEQSCDVYFYKLASMMKIDVIADYARRLGLGGRSGIDLPGELDSIIPSTEWKLKAKGEKWYAGDTISVGIGQGLISVTPISLASMISAIANGGTLITPHVVKAVDDGQGWRPLDPPGGRSFAPLPPQPLEVVRDGLWMAVNAAGTGTAARVAGHDVMGKTGTAQVVSLETAKAAGAAAHHFRDNSWFVFYAPRDNPEIAGVIFAEHAGWGATGATPIARYILETYFAKKEHRPKPVLNVTADGTMSISGGAAAPPKPGTGGGQ